jgi:hypothetical protein
MLGLRALIKSVLGSDSGGATRGTAASEFTATGKRIVIADGFRVELDLTRQVLAIHAPDRETDYRLDGEADAVEAPLSATLDTIDPTQPVSASVLAQKAKVFDDGLYAAAEVAAQEGAGRHTGKAGLLRSLGRALAGADPAVAGEVQPLLLGAARLGQVAIPGLPPAIETGVQRAVEEFLADEKRSKPIGFYTWSRHLASIFHQDRMLQGELTDPAGIEFLASALRADPSARTAYEAHLRLIARLTNPFTAPDLRGLLKARDGGSLIAPAESTRFFPPSAAHETEIVKQLYGDLPIPDDFVLVDEMIRRIRLGELDLAPRPESGWYDHQTWALEPLVIPERMPEGVHLQLEDGYRKLLLELFKGLMALTRETHIKQLEFPLCGSALGSGEEFIYIAPELAAEPLVTFYLRRALSYRFVRGVLEDGFGPGALERLHRLTQDGAVRASLAAELADIEMLFLGAHVSVSRQLGMAPDAAAGPDECAQAAADRFAAWARDPHQDPDLRQDLRAMVPVFYDLGRRKTKVWLFLGWSRREIEVSFARRPEATVLDRNGRPVGSHPGIRWGTLSAQLDYPVTAEGYVDRILDRAEFRGLCDRCGTCGAILRELGIRADAVSTDEVARGCRAGPVRSCALCGWQPRGDADDPLLGTCPRCGGTLRGRLPDA